MARPPDPPVSGGAAGAPTHPGGGARGAAGRSAAPHRALRHHVRSRQALRSHGSGTLGVTRPSRPRRRSGDESGQALVEFVLVLPLVALLMGVVFTGWNAMQLSVRLTSAARAGAIQAAADLANGDTQTQAATDATTAVNNEEGVTGVYQDTNPQGDDYVSVSPPTAQSVSGGSGTTTINVVTVTISRTAQTLIPFVGNIAVNTHATARFS